MTDEYLAHLPADTARKSTKDCEALVPGTLAARLYGDRDTRSVLSCTAVDGRHEFRRHGGTAGVPRPCTALVVRRERDVEVAIAVQVTTNLHDAATVRERCHHCRLKRGWIRA